MNMQLLTSLTEVTNVTDAEFKTSGLTAKVIKTDLGIDAIELSATNTCLPKREAKDNNV